MIRAVVRRSPSFDSDSSLKNLIRFRQDQICGLGIGEKRRMGDGDVVRRGGGEEGRRGGGEEGRRGEGEKGRRGGGEEG